MSSSILAAPKSFRPPTIKSKDFDNHVENWMKEWKVPGLALAVIDGGETIVKNYGWADLETGKVMDDNTLFDCASTSKSFAAASVGLVIEDMKKKELSKHDSPPGFDTPVNKFLPEDFVLENEYATANVTVEDILSHRSGMPRHDDSYLGSRAAKQDSPRTVTRNLRNLPLTRKLRTTYQYCNMMYTVATHLVQEHSKQSYGDFINERIWKPLGMNNTYNNIPSLANFDELKSRTTKGYYWSETEKKFTSVPIFDQTEAIGAGSVFSTVSDYAKWLRCMLTKSEPFSEETHDELRKPRIISEPDTAPKHGFSHTLYALGWEVKTYRGHRMIGHDGCVWGYNSSMLYLPDLDWGIVVFSNGNDGAADCNDTVAMTIIDHLLEIPIATRLDWNEIHKEEFKKCKEESKEEDAKEDENDEEIECSQAEDLSLDRYAGIYYNKGYHTLRLRLRDDTLTADMTDRSFPFHLDVCRKNGNHFVCRLRDDLDMEETPVKVRFQLDESSKQVLRIGVNLESAMDGDLIWFERVEEADPQKLASP